MAENRKLNDSNISTASDPITVAIVQDDHRRENRKLQFSEEFWYPSSDDPLSGDKSLKTPNLFNDEGIPGITLVTLTTQLEWGTIGNLHFSILADVKSPDDLVFVQVDTNLIDSYQESTQYVEYIIPNVVAGSEVTWTYRFNIVGGSYVPGSSGEAFIDDVYFIPTNPNQVSCFFDVVRLMTLLHQLCPNHVISVLLIVV